MQGWAPLDHATLIKYEMKLLSHERETFYIHSCEVNILERTRFIINILP